MYLREKNPPVPTEESKRRAVKLCTLALAGKLLYHQRTHYNQLIDEVVLADPERAGLFLYIGLTSMQGKERIYLREMAMMALDASELLAGLGNGDYSAYSELATDHPDAQRILQIYHHLCEIYALRGTREELVTKQALLPSPSEEQDDTAVQYT